MNYKFIFHPFYSLWKLNLHWTKPKRNEDEDTVVVSRWLNCSQMSPKDQRNINNVSDSLSNLWSNYESVNICVHGSVVTEQFLVHHAVSCRACDTSRSGDVRQWKRTVSLLGRLFLKPKLDTSDVSSPDIQLGTCCVKGAKAETKGLNVKTCTKVVKCLRRAVRWFNLHLNFFFVAKMQLY